MEGYIYKLVSKHVDKYYVGSTTKSLQTRLYYHQKNKDKSNITSKLILQYDDVTIELIETIIFHDVKELRAKEREYISSHHDECVNMRSIYKDRKDADKVRWKKNHKKLKEQATIYRNTHKDRINKLRRERYAIYRQQNPLQPRLTPEQKKENKKKYMKEHKEERKEYEKNWRDNNKDRLREKIVCECGGTYQHKHKSSHIKTKLHQKYINTL